MWHLLWYYNILKSCYKSIRKIENWRPFQQAYFSKYWSGRYDKYISIPSIDQKKIFSNTVSSSSPISPANLCSCCSCCCCSYISYITIWKMIYFRFFTSCCKNYLKAKHKANFFSIEVGVSQFHQWWIRLTNIYKYRQLKIAVRHVSAGDLVIE